jgi:hypothetical protein
MFCSNRDVRKLTVNSPLLTCQQHIPHLLCVDRTGPANNIQWDIRRLFQCWNPKSRLNANSIISFRFFFHVFPIEHCLCTKWLDDSIIKRIKKERKLLRLRFILADEKIQPDSRSSQGLGRTMCVELTEYFLAWIFTHSLGFSGVFFLRLTPISQRKVI